MTAWPIRVNPLVAPVTVQDGGSFSLSNIEHKLVVPAAVPFAFDTGQMTNQAHNLRASAPAAHQFRTRAINA
jgi:hypothetical protein